MGIRPLLTDHMENLKSKIFILEAAIPILKPEEGTYEVVSFDHPEPCARAPTEKAQGRAQTYVKV